MEEEIKTPIFRDIRRYYCQFCGICRSKNSLITSHILSHHKEEMKEDKIDGEEKIEKEKSNTCEECGASFKKPAYLKQHMLSHSLERLYQCSVGDCQASYRRKDHLTRHLLQHEGKLFECPIEGCIKRFSIQGNVKRHVREMHTEDSPSAGVESQKLYVCPEIGCEKSFKYPSKLQKHESSHVKLDSVEAICMEPECKKYFSDVQCLKAHIKSCHQYVSCEICGARQLKRNIKRHLRTHEEGDGPVQTIQCHFKGCHHKFSNKSNLDKHVKAVHFKDKPFLCGFPGCGMRFGYKHVRDNHEKSSCHTCTPGDFEESDEQFRSRPRGGRKRECPTVEMLTRKRVVPPNEMGDYHAWLQSFENQELL